jgi:hypothetical protein
VAARLNRFVAAAFVALAAAAPLGALAQGVPSYAEASPPYADGEENIHGRIVSFDGAYGLRVRDNRGYIDDVELRRPRSRSRLMTGAYRKG